MIKRIANLKSPEQFHDHIRKLDIKLDFDKELYPFSEFSFSYQYELKINNLSKNLSNRFCILPMEGWDAQTNGKPSELVYRRWQRFGQSGAKLIWGGEAVAVHPDGRANPNQLLINETNLIELAALRESLVASHAKRWCTDDLLIGLQLTHSGRFCRPANTGILESKILYYHPILNSKFGITDDYPVLSDDEISYIIEAYVEAAVLAQKAGFHFVDIKHCHGYLGHEFLSAVDRSGKYGGSFENRTRFLREIVDGIRTEAPGQEIGVRLSAFDFIPFQSSDNGTGEAVNWYGNYPYTFGGDGSGTGIQLEEPKKFLRMLETLNIYMVNISAGSAYYVPHI